MGLERDLIIIGAGAAGLAAAIFSRAAGRTGRILLLDGARKPGAKILVSGGSRCNVTNVAVTEADFWGGKRTIIRRVLSAFPAAAAVDFFRDLGVPLHEEAGGKLFPDSESSRDVRDALFREVARLEVDFRPGHRVTGLERTGRGFLVRTSEGDLDAAQVVLATGGLSLPRSGSDGAGYGFARSLGHSLAPTTPALVPLVLSGDFHPTLMGVSSPVELTLWVDERARERRTGPLLWTHFGASGPVVLDVSRHWLRARLEGRAIRLTASFFPGESFDSVERGWLASQAERPRASALTILSGKLPEALAAALLGAAGIDPTTPLSRLERSDRRRLTHVLTGFELPVTGSRGYDAAEVTAGGIPLTEIDPGTMESRICPRLFLIGEILDVDGRLGGFNFQWAWSSAHVAGAALAREDGL